MMRLIMILLAIVFSSAWADAQGKVRSYGKKGKGGGQGCAVTDAAISEIKLTEAESRHCIRRFGFSQIFIHSFVTAGPRPVYCM